MLKKRKSYVTTGVSLSLGMIFVIDTVINTMSYITSDLFWKTATPVGVGRPAHHLESVASCAGETSFQSPETTALFYKTTSPFLQFRSEHICSAKIAKLTPMKRTGRTFTAARS